MIFFNQGKYVRSDAGVEIISIRRFSNYICERCQKLMDFWIRDSRVGFFKKFLDALA